MCYKPLPKSSTSSEGLYEKEQNSLLLLSALKLPRGFGNRISFDPDLNPLPAGIPPALFWLIPQGSMAFGWKNSLLTCLPGTSSPNRTPICHPYLLSPSRATLQGIGGDSTVTNPDLRLGWFSH